MKGERIKTAVEKILVAMIIIYICMAMYDHVVNGVIMTSKRTEDLSTGWYYLLDGKKVPLILPAKVESEWDSLIIYNDRTLREFERGTLLIRGMQYEPDVRIGGLLLYEYDDSQFQRNEQMAKKLQGVVQLPVKMDGKKLSITYHGRGDGVYEIPKIYIGSSEATFCKHILNDGVGLCVTFVMLIFGIVASVINLYLRRKDMKDKRFDDMVLLVILSSIWGLTDSSFIQYLFGYLPIIYYFSVFALMLIPVPVLCFARNTSDLKENQLVNWGPTVFYANFVLQAIFRQMGILKFSQMMAVTHTLMLVGIGLLNGCVLKEYQRKNTEEVRQLFFATAIMGAGGLISFVCYWILKTDHYEVPYLISIMIFLIVSLCRMILSVADAFFNRTEAEVYNRLIKRDGLTGMRNQQSFHDYVTKIDEGEIVIDDAALVFIRIQNLKEINDHYGHRVGDAAIIEAGKCVEDAYKELGDCFRLRNGEFCVVLPDTEETEENIQERLDMRLERHNQESDYALQFAVGISYLKDEEGFWKSMSDWKFEADQKMNLSGKSGSGIVTKAADQEKG